MKNDRRLCRNYELTFESVRGGRQSCNHKIIIEENLNRLLMRKIHKLQKIWWKQRSTQANLNND